MALPGDKSITHRAIILNSIAAGDATLSNYLPGADCLSTINCLRALGAAIEELPSSPPGLMVHGAGTRGLKEPVNVLDAGNSGTTIRLLTGLLAAQPFFSVITGDDSLRSRPMGRVIQPLRLMGAQVWGRGSDSLAPLAIKGQPLKGITYSLPVASAQLKSALLLAGLFAQGSTTLTEPALSRDHTERQLRAMGARIRQEGKHIVLKPLSSPLKALDVNIPGDLSAGAYWLVAGAIHPKAKIVILNCGVNPTRTGILDALTAMGGKIRLLNQRTEGGEPVADIQVESSELAGTELRGEIIPRIIDEIPVLAVAACCARGKTVIRDAAELRVKESDRIATTSAELRKMGARIEELPDGMIIHGGQPLKGAAVESHGDHRLAMSLAVAALVAEGKTTVRDAGAVSISYPAFWERLENLSKTKREL